MATESYSNKRILSCFFTYQSLSNYDCEYAWSPNFDIHLELILNFDIQVELILNFNVICNIFDHQTKFNVMSSYKADTELMFFIIQTSIELRYWQAFYIDEIFH
jgi:hypothetical protein